MHFGISSHLYRKKLSQNFDELGLPILHHHVGPSWFLQTSHQNA